MSGLDTRERLAAAEAAVERACALLQSPNAANLDESAGALEDAGKVLAAIPAHEAAQSPLEARRLSESIRHAAALLDQAAQFHDSWRRMRNAMCSGYQPGGGAAEADFPVRLCFRG